MTDDLKQHRKIYCSVSNSVHYVKHCLFELQRVASENNTCQGCVYYENLELRKRVEKGNRNKEPEVKAKKKRGPKPKTADPEPFYTIQELSDRLKKSIRRLQEWAKEGKIPSEKIKGHYHFPREAVDRWLSSGERLSTEKQEQQTEVEEGPEKTCLITP